ncbi:uncharacterized protein LOC131428592 [Malaya genurostris]|uniref:uncharacterized protein LOC131428592 n=1 Tax=Malaya genurostris TaxID=325434 RepID=UPI0026F38F87|nr:uncharacterized protein LOC131428592 [Malaya genurostris]
MNFLNFYLLVCSLFVLTYAKQSNTNPKDDLLPRQKRALIFPRGNPTRHQLVAGFGIPVDIVLESITIGYVFKAVYFLPWNASHWIPQFLRRDEDLLFEPTGEEIQQQRRNFVEVNNEIDADDVIPQKNYNWADRARWMIYQALEGIVEHKGFNGRTCLLRTICEVAEAKFTHSSGILGELLHILFTPSTTNEPAGDSSGHNDYRSAEFVAQHTSPRYGRSVCSEMFRECPLSLLDMFTGVKNNGFG